MQTQQEYTKKEIRKKLSKSIEIYLGGLDKKKSKKLKKYVKGKMADVADFYAKLLKNKPCKRVNNSENQGAVETATTQAEK